MTGFPAGGPDDLAASPRGADGDNGAPTPRKMASSAALYDGGAKIEHCLCGWHGSRTLPTRRPLSGTLYRLRPPTITYRRAPVPCERRLFSAQTADLGLEFLATLAWSMTRFMWVGCAQQGEAAAYGGQAPSGLFFGPTRAGCCHRPSPGPALISPRLRRKWRRGRARAVAHRAAGRRTAPGGFLELTLRFTRTGLSLYLRRREQRTARAT